MIVKHFGKFDEKKFGEQWKYQSKINPPVSRKLDVGSSKKFVVEKKDEGKCFSYRGVDHFARYYKVKKNNTKE